MKSVLTIISVLCAFEFSIAATLQDTSLAGTRVNPVRYYLAPKWEVKIHDGHKNNWDTGSFELREFDLGKPTELNEFHRHISDLITADQAEAKAKGKKKGFLPKAAAAALEELRKLTLLLLNNSLNAQDRADAFMHVAEVTQAFNYNFKYPLPRKVLLIGAPFKLLDELDNPIMATMGTPSTNIVADAKTDLSLVDPASSSFWKNPGSIASKNLYYGFGRSDLSTFPNVCEYDEPKDGYGTNGGFTIKCDKKKWKIKFGEEAKVEPFTTRIVWAMGFNALPIDYAKDVKVTYDRKILTEYNSRQNLILKLSSIFGFDYAKKNLQIHLDPFQDAIKAAVLKSGETINAADLRQRLLSRSEPKSELNNANYNTAFESQINFLVMRDANMEPTLGDDMKNLGPWSWNALDHETRRETRAFGMISAFMAMWDTRNDNNRLRLKTDDQGRKHLLHFVSDLGGGLGKAENFMSIMGASPNDFPWEFMRKYTDENSDELFRVTNVNALNETRPFRQMQMEDAKWMARRLAQITEQQFVDALVASGWSAAETKLYLEKLLSRRDNMIRVLGLDKEIALMRPAGGVNKKFNYDPSTSHRPYAAGSRGYVQAPVSNQRIVEGKVVSF